MIWNILRETPNPAWKAGDPLKLKSSFVLDGRTYDDSAKGAVPVTEWLIAQEAADGVCLAATRSA